MGEAPGRVIRALLVDDVPLARRGLRQLLAAHPDVVVAGECRDGREALVNVARVRTVRSEEGETTIVLRDGTRLPASRRRRAALLRALRSR